MKILITGGAGFIGSSLADRLLSDVNEIVVIDNFNDYYDPKINESNVAPYAGDVRYPLVRDDIVAGIRAAIAYDKTPYEVINLGGGEPITLKRMIGTIEKVLGKKAEIVTKPMQPGDLV